jgi:hypothetical protein
MVEQCVIIKTRLRYYPAGFYFAGKVGLKMNYDFCDCRFPALKPGKYLTRLVKEFVYLCR